MTWARHVGKTWLLTKVSVESGTSFFYLCVLLSVGQNSWGFHRSWVSEVLSRSHKRNSFGGPYRQPLARAGDDELGTLDKA